MKSRMSIWMAVLALAGSVAAVQPAVAQGGREQGLFYYQSGGRIIFPAGFSISPRRGVGLFQEADRAVWRGGGVAIEDRAEPAIARERDPSPLETREYALNPRAIMIRERISPVSRSRPDPAVVVYSLGGFEPRVWGTALQFAVAP